MLRPARFLLAAAVVLLAGSASAVPITFSVQRHTGGTWTSTGLEGVSDGSQYGYEVADGQQATTNWTLAWQDVSFDIDPGVSGNWALTNNTAGPQIFTVSVMVPVLAVTPSSLMFGSSSITVSDANFSGSATLSTVGASALYYGTIDTVAVGASALYSPAYSLTAGSPGGTNSQTQSFGVFPGSVAGPAVVGFIGIQHTFSLTAGDRATFDSTFHLIPVPEPGTLALATIGLAGIGIMGRRRS